MAKRKKVEIEIEYINGNGSNRLPENGKMHKKAKAVSRDHMLDVYSNYEIKNDMVNQYRYDDVDSVYSSFYAGIDPARKKEMADGGMVREDRNAIANLSNTPVHQEYPKSGYSSNPFLDDSTKD